MKALGWAPVLWWSTPCSSWCVLARWDAIFYLNSWLVSICRIKEPSVFFLSVSLLLSTLAFEGLFTARQRRGGTKVSVPFLSPWMLWCQSVFRGCSPILQAQVLRGGAHENWKGHRVSKCVMSHLPKDTPHDVLLQDLLPSSRKHSQLLLNPCCFSISGSHYT